MSQTDIRELDVSEIQAVGGGSTTLINPNTGLPVTTIGPTAPIGSPPIGYPPVGNPPPVIVPA